MHNVVEQFHTLYSRRSILDTAAKEAQLEDMLSRAQGTYRFLVQSYGR